MMSLGGEIIECSHCGEAIEADSIICQFCYSGISKRWFYPCPLCAEVIRKDCTVCKFCKAVLPAVLTAGKSLEQEELAEEFRKTFLAEIGHFLNYKFDSGDGLNMIVNVLGRGLQVSRCLIYCTYPGTTAWHYAEYYKSDEAQKCSSLNWHASKSGLVVKTILAEEPISISSGQIRRPRLCKLS
jgi:hypothetical protein